MQKIVVDQAEDYGHTVRDSTDPYFSIETGGDLRYDLLYTRPEEGVKAVAEYDVDVGEVVDFQKIDEIVEDSM
ncbi:hypothetical protein [Natrinema altunense]|uniref:Uncharacterized protein n=1 Tax=Natrinema altunense (strain JCM 12890 / CGMCC 1.3731 / AJ2) TaxID=1227494 RepID=L9ZAU8_NATA2|nr:hypothetical protein [Natrinema altunense]ELY83600.1 hypothetical protein C485_17647 [Natrinema altunense JCM 12890]